MTAFKFETYVKDECGDEIRLAITDSNCLVLEDVDNIRYFSYEIKEAIELRDKLSEAILYMAVKGEAKNE